MTLQLPKINTDFINMKEDEEEKKKLLGVSELTYTERMYSLSALKIFYSRYLVKDDNGQVCERLDDLFRRVAVGVGIMDLLYLPEFYDKEAHSTVYSVAGLYMDKTRKRLEELKEYNQQVDYKDAYDPGLNPYCVPLNGEYIVNSFHMERLMERYLELCKSNHMIATFDDILKRMQDQDIKEMILPQIKEFYYLMQDKVFLPNTPALMNCGSKLGQNAACFTLDVKDDLRDIYDTYTDSAMIFKSGGGVGINWSNLRPEGAFVKGTGGKSSGVISFLKNMDTAVVGTVSQGGKRRGAAMAIMNMEHPSIEQFIDLKDNKTLENHNISICTPDTFFQDLMDGGEKERYLMDKITKNAWKTGDPGMVFLENMNRNNMLEGAMGGKPIQVTNPCSEIAMYPNESCILASINLTKFVYESKKEFDFESFAYVVRIVTHFLDNMIDASNYPLDKINNMTKACRRIGVGFMGLADTLVKLGIPYNSEEGFQFAKQISFTMTVRAQDQSELLGRLRGSYPLWHHNNKDNRKGWRPQRNCEVTTIAPTGTLSMFVDVSSGVEPIFALSFIKKVTLGDFTYINKDLEKALKDNSVTLTEGPIKGSIQGRKDIPDSIKEIFVTAMDIHPYDHIMMQAACQKYITNGISKTINAPHDIHSKLIEYCYVLSWALGNKGITVYRDKCKDTQVLNGDSYTSIDCVCPVSEYTIEQIKNISEIPDSYKKQLILACTVKEDSISKTPPIAKYFGTKLIDKWNLGELSEEVKELAEIALTPVMMRCPSCNATNFLQKIGRGDSCFLCNSCGHSMGTCDL